MVFSIVFRHPFGMQIIGPTASGKTQWLFNLLKEKEKLIQPTPDFTVLFYEADQEIYHRMTRENLVDQLVEGHPESYEELKTFLTELKGKYNRILAIFDDARLAYDTLAQLFTVGSAHLSCSAIVLSQQLFGSNEALRVVSANSSYYVLMKSIRNLRGISTLASQISPHSRGFIVNSFLSSTRQPYGYLILDMKANQSDAVRLRTRIFSHEGLPLCFLQNSF